MYEYLQINIFLSVLALICLFLVKSSPARLKFIIIMVVLCAWMVPWGVLKIELPMVFAKPFQEIKYQSKDYLNRYMDVQADSNNAHHSIRPSFDSNHTRSDHDSQLATFLNSSAGQYSTETQLSVLLLAAMVLGAGLFLVNVRQYARMTDQYNADSRPADYLKDKYTIVPRSVPVRILKKSTVAMTGGFTRPIIWIGSEIQDERLLETALTHESVHIRSHDHLWNWVLLFFARVFWWNPFIFYLVRKAKAYIELSCDERSNKLVQGDHYMESLVKLIILNNEQRVVGHTLGVQGAFKSLDVWRIEEIVKPKKLHSGHIGFMVAVAGLSVMMSLGIAYDSIIRRLVPNTQFVSTQIQNFAGPIDADVFESDRPYLELAQHVYRQDYEKAEEKMAELLAQFQLANVSIEEKITGFRVMTMLLGDQGQYRSLLALADSLFSYRQQFEDREISRIVAIAHINLGQYDEAVDIIRDSVAAHEGYHGHPSSILEAQALHMLGEYQQSNAILNMLIEHWNRDLYAALSLPILRLYGKNSLMMGDLEGQQWAKRQLGSFAPQDFSDVTANNQKVPYVYFLRRTLNDVPIDGFADDAFPLSPLTNYASLFETREILGQAIKLTNQHQDAKAKHILQKYLAEMDSRQKAQWDQTKVMEHLFLLLLKLENHVEALDLSKQLVERDAVSRPILARALWLLSVGTKEEMIANIHYFERYLSLLETPSISADHETIERYYWLSDENLYKDALSRVEQFYVQHGVVPDLKILNRMIALYKVTGDHEKLSTYKTLLKRTYPRTTNFIFE